MTEQNIEVMEMPESFKGFLPEKQPATTTEEAQAETKTEATANTETSTETTTTEKTGGDTKESESTTQAEAATTKEAEPAPNWFDLSEPTKQTTETAAAEQAKVDFEREYKSLLSNPEMALLIEAQKAGKSPLEVLKEYQPVDYSAMDAKTLCEKYGSKDGWNAEEIEAEFDIYESKSKTEQKQMRKEWQSELESDQKSKTEKLVGSYQEQAKKAEEAKQYEKFVENKFFQDVDKEASFMESKEVAGLKLTSDHSKAFKEFAHNFTMLNEDGTYNVPFIRQCFIGAKLIGDIQKAYHSKGQSEGRIEVLKGVHRPNEQTSAPTRTPETAPAKSTEQKTNEVLEAMMSGKLQPITK